MSINIKKTLKNLGFKQNEIEVYIALTELGEALASEVAKKVGIARTTVISILNKLEGLGYLTTHKYKGKIRYWVESPRVIADVFKNKADLADSLENSLSAIYREGSAFPFAKVYDTKAGIKNFTENILLKAKKKSIIYTIDSPQEGNYRKIFSGDLEAMFFNIKRKRQLVTKTLIPFGSYKDVDYAKVEAQDIEIKEMPKGMGFESSVWIIGDVICLFSGNPPFLVAINHKSIRVGIKSIYDFLWSVSVGLDKK